MVLKKSKKKKKVLILVCSEEKMKGVIVFFQPSTWIIDNILFFHTLYHTLVVIFVQKWAFVAAEIFLLFIDYCKSLETNKALY